ncbi:HlyD family efflux transporter periplasmic adaptor subunit [Nostoc sp.]|uniref:HlyD family efflux transporter periplasmic adaptor subunit n=1 Tax=Nostoc sp. TaxID=1180 RepID=UPI002FF8C4CA
MPNPSRNSSSLVNAPKSAEDSSEVKERSPAQTQTGDWFYGTEELLDALPRRWTRSMLYLIVGFTAIALPWAMLSQVDETGSARGRIEPLGATQRIDSPASGNVITVRVKEGETVKAGQTLVELESNLLRTDLQQAQAKLSGQLNQQRQLELLKNQLQVTIHTQQQQNQAQQSEKLAQVQQAQQNLDTLKSAYNLQKEEKLAKVNQARQAVDSSKAARELAQVRFQGAKEKIPRYKKVYQEGAIAQDRFLEVEQSVKENYQNLVQAKSEIAQAQSGLQEQQNSYQRAINQAEADIQQAQLRLQEQQRNQDSLIHTGELAMLKTTEQLKDLQSQIAAMQSEIAQIKSQIASLNLQLQQRVVRSPIDGIIFALPIDKPGSVVQPGQMIAQISPKESPFVLKAEMPSQQSGFLKVGARVKIKFDAYPFQDYGVMLGRVSHISPDSKVKETNSGKIETFDLDIALQQPYIQNGDKRILITPGQTATAEVIIRQRRVIDFILDPFKKLQKGGLEL